MRFWLCRVCAHTNPDSHLLCTECGSPRGAKFRDWDKGFIVGIFASILAHMTAKAFFG